MPALGSLNATLTTNLTWTAAVNQVGSDYQPNQNQSTIPKTVKVANTLANNAAGGGDQLISKIYSIAGGGNTAIDLTALIDILLQTGVSLARVKAIMMRLLSTADDSTNGTAAASITVGNNATNDFTSQAANRGWLGTATSVFDIPNGGVLVFGAPNANGVLVDVTHKIIKVTNNDGAVGAAVQVSILGGTT